MSPMSSRLLEHRVVKRRISFGTDVVAPDIDLDAARVVLQFEEGGAAHDAARHDASGDADALKLFFAGSKFSAISRAVAVTS